jgi:hypothetical protein
MTATRCRRVRTTRSRRVGSRKRTQAVRRQAAQRAVEIRSIRGVDTLRVHTKQISVQPNPWFKALSFPLFRPFKVKPEVLCQPNRSRSSRILVERSLSPLDRAGGESGSSFERRGKSAAAEIRGLKSGRRLDKLLRVRGGCLGTKRRRRTRLPAKSVGELEANDDPAVSEWGNPSGVMSRHSRLNT